MPEKKKKTSGMRLFPLGSILCACLGIIALAICSICIVYTDYPAERVVMFALAAYIGCMIVCLAVSIIVTTVSRRGAPRMAFSVTQGVSVQFLQKLKKPVVICDDKGKIVWYNQQLKDTVRKGGLLFNKYIDNICDATIERIVKSDDMLGAEVRFVSAEEADADSSEVYNAVGYDIRIENKIYYMAIFTDITALKDAQRELSDQETILAYAMIDNLDELLQYIQELYTNVSTEVEEILEKYFQKVGGVVRSYGHNRFICMFAAKYLHDFEEDKFSLLDEVREIRYADATTPVTVSLGIAKISGTLYEKERATQAALDMALQRGGDQVVIKTAEGVEFYGGKTKAVQKRTKVRSRVIANELIALISKSDNVIVMGHKFADMDAFASCLAVARIAKFCGAKVNIVMDRSDRNLKSCFRLVDECPEYDGIFVDRTEAQDLIMSDTLAVVVDVNNIDFCEAPDVVNSVNNIAIIDHHRKASEFKRKPNIVYIEPSASSASELMSELLELIIPQGTLTKTEADLLFAGMLLDTKQFTHNAGVRTFGSAQYLRGEGASPIDAQALFKTEISDFLSEARFESNVSIYKNVIAIALNEKDTDNTYTRINAAKAADRLLNVEGICAAFALCSVNGTIHISARSDGSVNVQRILEKLGGGGHFDAAGTQLQNTGFKEALALLRAAIDEILDIEE
ncbi:MAG: DHH family phosphoesterase [Eubacteriales bacterium]